MSILSKPYFHNEATAFDYVESIIWPDGPTCPHCGECERINALTGVRSKPSKKNPEGVARHGLKKCYSCRKQFTVKVGTIFESSHVPLYKWLQATFLMASSKKGISSHQLHRILEVTYKTAWFMSHRLREAMRELHVEPMGGNGKIVEADETYFGGLEKNKHRNKRLNAGRGTVGKEAVFSLVERGGRVCSQHVKRVNAETLKPIMKEQIAKETHLMTDEAYVYRSIGSEFVGHDVVQHGIGQYVRGDIHTNTIEGYFGIFKRGMKGIYQHCKSHHLKRYLAEFDFRYNHKAINDIERTVNVLSGIVGKRLLYRDSSLV